MSRLTHWQLLSRPGCGLCDDMMEALVTLLGPAAEQIRVIDVDDHPDLATQYGRRLPVLLVDGEMVCCYRLDAERVRDHLPAGFDAGH